MKFKNTSLALTSSGLLLFFAHPALATNISLDTPSLTYSSLAYVDGTLNSSYNSPLLGNTNLNIQLGSSSASGSDIATVNKTIAAGEFSNDPIYNIVTSNGQYGFSYNGTAQVQGTQLKTQLVSSVVNSNGDLVEQADNSSLSTRSMAGWSQGFYIGADANHSAGSYGAMLVGITLDGIFPALSDPSISNNSGAYLLASSNFTDTAGVSYSSTFNIFANEGTWTGSETAYKKLLFQYGTPFEISLDQWFSTYNTPVPDANSKWYGVDGNGNADFSHTGLISSIELPYGTTLLTGAQLAGLGSLNSLFGNVTNSATLNAINTNWDFGNNGGGFRPPSQVPVPATAWLFGSAFAGLIGLRRRKSS